MTSIPNTQENNAKTCNEIIKNTFRQSNSSIEFNNKQPPSSFQEADLTLSELLPLPEVIIQPQPWINSINSGVADNYTDTDETKLIKAIKFNWK